MPRIVEPTAAALSEAAAILRSGGVVALPTETVYGLGADTFNPVALERLFELKGRPRDNPLIAHVLNAQQASTLVSAWDDRCDALASHFWPGPLTLVVPRAESVPPAATAGLTTIAVRSPAHPVARNLLEQFGSAISAPSANRSGHVSPTTANHVADDFATVDDLLILDGGPCELGIESTVLDISRAQPMVLRPGSISVDAIAAALDQTVTLYGGDRQAASPGTASAHYAPCTPVALVQSDAIDAHLAALAGPAVVLAYHHPDVPSPHVLLAMPDIAEAYAAELYQALRQADTLGCHQIVIELPVQPGPVWDAVRNRLHRAAAKAAT